MGGAVHRDREKYNVVSDSPNFKLAEGYRDNIVGFGWTFLSNSCIPCRKNI